MEVLKQYLSKFNYFVALILAFSLSMPDSWVIKVFFVWSASWAVDVVVNKRYLSFSLKKQSWAMYAMIVFYAIMLISLLYTDNVAYAGKVLIRRISMLIIPLMLSIGFSSSYKMKPLLLAFLCGAMFSLCVMLGLPVIRYMTDFRFQNRVHAQPLIAAISAYLDFKHRTFGGVIQIFAILVFLYLRKDLKPVLKEFYWPCFIAYMAVFFAFMSLMGGRIVLIAFLSLVLVFALWMIWQKKWRKTAIIGIAIIMISAIVLYSYHPRFQNIHFSEMMKKESLNQKEPRIGLWISSIELLKENHQWLFGVGIGDSKDALVLKYAENNLSTETTENRMHPHNTFLNTLVETGISGMLVWLFLWAIPLICARGKTRIYVCAGQFIFLLVMMVDVITMQIGILLFYLLCQLIYIKLPEIQKEEASCLFSIRGIKPYFIGVDLVLLLLISITCTYPLYGKNGYSPEDPQTYAVCNYILLDTLPGNYPEELSHSKGYLLDASSESLYNKNSMSAEFTTPFYLREDSSRVFSVWCYVSEDFNGEDVQIHTASPVMETRFSSPYNLNQKGLWQKLVIDYSTVSINKEIPFVLFFREINAKDFSSLNGYVVFARPVFE